MKTITMQLEKKYQCKLIISHDILSNIDTCLIPLLKEKEVVMITNPLVKQLYADRLVHDLSSQGIIVNIIEVPDGEKSKSLSVANKIYDQLLELKVNRSTTLITLGGGVIGDLGGFVAATFMRGIPLIHVPTTLLAQIDSSIGGKVAVDHPRAKNMVGSFYQPVAVLVDPLALETLPVAHLKNGLVEAIKIAIIQSPSFFQWLDQNIEFLLQKNREALYILVNQAIQLKSDIVLQDPWEKQKRLYLNLGHSIGHALEAMDGYDNITHGEAVAAGIILETCIACHRNICRQEEKIKIESIIKKLQFSVRLNSGNFDLERCWDTILLDKKNSKGFVRFVLPEKIGKVQLVQPILKEDITFAFNTLFERIEE
jgi:3-dehydroquinate synthase